MNEHEGRTFEQARAVIHAAGLAGIPKSVRMGMDMAAEAEKQAIIASRYVTDAGPDEAERYALYRLCECASCDGSGRTVIHPHHSPPDRIKCPDCRGEGRTRDLIATCGTPEALGVAIVTLAREGEWEGCPIGILDTLGEPGEKWLVRPWLPSARNITDAARTLAKSKTREKT